MLFFSYFEFQTTSSTVYTQVQIVHKIDFINAFTFFFKRVQLQQSKCNRFRNLDCNIIYMYM